MDLFPQTSQLFRTSHNASAPMPLAMPSKCSKDLDADLDMIMSTTGTDIPNRTVFEYPTNDLIIIRSSHIGIFEHPSGSQNGSCEFALVCGIDDALCDVLVPTPSLMVHSKPLLVSRKPI